MQAQLKARTAKKFRISKHELMSLQVQSSVERRILDHWRDYEPKKVESLMTQGILRRVLRDKAEALLDLQIALEKLEKLNPVLAESEAWNRLMRHEEDAAEEATAWGMTLEDYLNRS